MLRALRIESNGKKVTIKGYQNNEKNITEYIRIVDLQRLSGVKVYSIIGLSWNS